MKSYEEFKEFYSEELLAELLELDKLRKGLLIKSGIITIIVFIAASLVFPFFLIEDFESFELAILFWILCGWVWFAAIRFFGQEYRSNFKKMIIEPLIRFIDPHLRYSSEGSIDLLTFRRAEIFQRYVNDLKGEDLVAGTIGKTSILFSEVRAYYNEENDQSVLGSIFEDESGSVKNPKCKKRVFKGLFFVADFNKDFFGQVLIMPDKAEKFFGRFGKMLQSHNIIRGKLMNMDNAEFEKKFVVYGSDQIQTRYVLSPAIMNKILDFHKKTENSICLSFKNSILYIAVPCKRNLFEPKYFKSLVDYIDTFQYFQDLRLFIGIVDEFNLNTRIWTKE